MSALQNLISFGKVVVSNAAGGAQTLQLTGKAGEPPTQTDLEHVEPFGFTANPPDGAEGIILAIDDDDEVCLLVGGRAWRFKNLGKGEVALYNAHGELFVLADGRVYCATPDLRLGSDSATQGVARIGDTVEVTITAGSLTDSNGDTSPMSPTVVTGTITGGSSVVKAI